MKLSFVRKGLLTMTSIVLMLATGGAVTPSIAAPTTQSGIGSHSTKVDHPIAHVHQVVHHQPNADTAPKPQPVPYIQLGTSGQNALWMNEALALLHYLPVQFQPSTTQPSSTGESVDATQTPAVSNDSSPTAVAPSSVLAAGLQSATLTPLAGTWAWTAEYPSSLTSLWDPNTASVITQGAIMHFQHDHGLDVDGIAGPVVYHALSIALNAQQVNTQPYTYVSVSKTGTEHLDIWQSGQKVYSTLANTGISASPTPNGTWPVFARFTAQTMQGTDPSGAKYCDPGVPWVSYFYQGCAIHGFPRASYGSPQSLGCVELSLASAETVYNLLDYGTLVTVGA